MSLKENYHSITRILITYPLTNLRTSEFINVFEMEAVHG